MNSGGDDTADIEELVALLHDAVADSGEITIGDIQDRVGRRAFGPPLLIFSLIALSPIGGIPGVPTLFGMIVILLSGQVLFGMKRFWLPRIIRKRSLDNERLRAGLEKIRPAASKVDGVLRPRLTFLVQGPAVYALAATCSLLAIAIPTLEVVPFAASTAVAAIAVFALAMVANDGLLALLGYAVSFGALYSLAAILNIPFGIG